MPVNDLFLALGELQEALDGLEMVVPVAQVRQEVVHTPPATHTHTT